MAHLVVFSPVFFLAFPLILIFRSGTGKTLMARALANSCSEGGKQVSFFMRKGADCLSKWVGEAERQLRLLFEQAKNMQPAIVSTHRILLLYVCLVDLIVDDRRYFLMRLMDLLP
jgi:AAA+ superfamily predicted ATPase